MCLHQKARDDETTEYVDVVSLYPYICKYYKIPIGHPKINVGVAGQDIELCLKMEGLIKCLIVPTKTCVRLFFHLGTNRNLRFVCVDLTCCNRTLVNSAGTFLTQRGLSQALGS
jgi:hypothetical protein